MDELLSWYGGTSSNRRPSGTSISVGLNLGEAAGVLLPAASEVLERAEEDLGRVLVILIHTSSGLLRRLKLSVRLLPHRCSIVAGVVYRRSFLELVLSSTGGIAAGAAQTQAGLDAREELSGNWQCAIVSLG